MVTEPFHLLTFDDYGDAIGRAATVLRANAAAAPLEATVPVCPDWTVLDLVTHVGMVHRWATDHLRGRRGVDPAAHETEGREAGDLLGWFDTGATALLQALVDAPEDLDALVFLRDAPPAPVFWARRQAHETTIHAVDALGARLGRPPAPEETWIRTPLALDGIDELLSGFVPRGRRQAVHAPAPTTLLVRPDAATVAWHVTMSPDEPAVTRRVDMTSDSLPGADRVLTGHAVEVYLSLWNRTDGAGEHEAWWREVMKVTWA
jgi:uncharacterized protein (TIGR03083 family)